MTRYDQCDETCTTDCGHCKGRGLPHWTDIALDRVAASGVLNVPLDPAVFRGEVVDDV